MPAPTCTCIVCNNQVSKRQSLSIDYNGQTGRACRSHPEVSDYLQKQFESAENEKQMKQINTTMRVMALTSFIEVQKAINPLFLESYYLRKVKHMYGEETHNKVVEELSQRQPLTPTDIASSIMVYQQLMSK